VRSVLVTGAAGYLGSVLVPAMIKRGWRVYALDTYPHGNTIFADLCTAPFFEPIKGDARDSRVMLELLPKVDAVLPLAALVGAPICSEREHDAVTTNTEAIRLITRNTGFDQAIVFPATDSGYPIGEVDETSIMAPVSLYARSKYEGERHVLERRGIALRLASVFGMAPQMRLDLIVNDFTWRAVTDHAVTLFEPNYRRNFVHVRDVAQAFIHALDQFADMREEVYNVGDSAACMTKQQLCSLIAKYVPRFTWAHFVGTRDPDRRDCIVSNAKIEATGWKPLHSLDSGVQELIKGYTMLRNSRWSNV
jgi:nucleoside-diphosphate-sugar epimerase